MSTELTAKDLLISAAKNVDAAKKLKDQAISLYMTSHPYKLGMRLYLEGKKYEIVRVSLDEYEGYEFKTFYELTTITKEGNLSRRPSDFRTVTLERLLNSDVTVIPW